MGRYKCKPWMQIDEIALRGVKLDDIMKRRRGYILVRIGKLELPAGAALAPMAGVSDAAMRLLCHEQGAAWSVSEMLSAKGWIYSGGKNRNAQELLTRLPGEGIAALQLFGSDPQIMADAAQELATAGFDFYDLNFGCPAPKITGNGEGSALMRDPQLIGRIVRAMVDAVDVPVTVKIRAGWDAEHINAVEVAQICEQAGAAAIAVHGRTRMQQYSGHADWSVIREVKRHVSVPVFGNGDVRSGRDALRMMDETGCDAVLVARAAEGNPWLFSEISAALAGEDYTPPTPRQRVETALRHFQLEEQLHGERGGMLEMRKHIAWYISGMRGAARFREQINALESAYAVKNALMEFAESAERE